MILRIAALAFGGALAGSAHSALVYATSFEPYQGYGAGPVSGQQGWATTPGSNHGYTVTPGRASQGLWSLRQEFTNTGAFWATQTSVPDLFPGQTVQGVLARVDIYIEPGFTGALFGIDMFSGANRVAATVINATGRVYVYNQFDNFWAWSHNPRVVPNQWVTLELLANFNTGTSKVWVNGVHHPIVGTFSSVSITDVDLLSLRETSADTNLAYFDMYVLRTVPEPATVAALGLGCLALLRRRSRTSS
jgi:hypothetical protein